jgi:uncharacterized repeat protein (TIGR01451 family)
MMERTGQLNLAFLHARGVAAAIARALFAIALLTGVAASAQTSCSTQNRFEYSFAAQPAAALNYATTYNWTAANPLGATQAFSAAFFINGLSSTSVAGNTMPRITNLINDGAPTTANNLMIGGTLSARTTNITSNVSVMRVTFTFPVDIREFTIQVNDIDFATNQYRDWLHIQGVNGANTYVPTITTPFGNTNGSGPFTATNSTLQLGASTTPLTVGASEAIGNATSGNNINNGTLTATFAQPVRTVVLSYGNSAQAPGGTTSGQQAYGIQFIRFCPMPNIVANKTSALVATTGIDSFHVPGAFVDYTIQVQNTGGSTVDLNSTVIADLLPSGVTYFHGDIDPGSAGTQTFVFTPGTSGLTLAAGNVGYSNNNGASYAYAPATGLDTNVDGLRFSPQGTMAANSSFTVRFRVAIN